MNTKEKLKLLKDWQEKIQGFRKETDKFAAVLGGAATDAPLFTQMYFILDAYTDTLSLLLGDNLNWLNWWMWENGGGSKKLKVKMGEKMIVIKNLEGLLKIIEEGEANK